MEYYSILTKKEILTHVTTRMLENEVVSEMENLKNEVEILKTLVDNLMKCQNVTINQTPKQSPYQKNIWSLN